MALFLARLSGHQMGTSKLEHPIQMGTRKKGNILSTNALVHIIDSEGAVITTIYKHWDGYPSGVGNQLKEMLTEMAVNSCSGNRGFNDAHCLAAFVIAQLKGDRWGDVYVYPPGTSNMGEEFIYLVSLIGGQPSMVCVLVGFGDEENRAVFVGNPANFNSDQIDGLIESGEPFTPMWKAQEITEETPTP